MHSSWIDRGMGEGRETASQQLKVSCLSSATGELQTKAS